MVTRKTNVILVSLFFFFLPGFSFTNIHQPQDYRGKERAFPQFLTRFTDTSTRFTDTQTLAGRLLQRTHLCTQLAAGLEPGTFGVSIVDFEHVSHFLLLNLNRKMFVSLSMCLKVHSKHSYNQTKIYPKLAEVSKKVLPDSYSKNQSNESVL